MDNLTIESLKSEAKRFAEVISSAAIAELYGITDGKAVGTFVEIELHEYLRRSYSYTSGSAAIGVDFPDLDVDVKATSIRQPQSSSPFRTAAQKVYGLGHHLLVFVYNKQDDAASRIARLDIKHIVFVHRDRTADYQTTYGLSEIRRRDGNLDDIVGFLEERNLPLDDVGRQHLAERILREPPTIGHLTVSNALQWRLQFGRVIAAASSGETTGVEDLLAQRSG